MPGFPIRTPSDHSSVDSSPRTIAASRVLHRLLMPRHPPCALKHLFTTRCSHPLCNTQHTTTPRPPRPPPPRHPHGRPGVRRSGPGAARKNTANRRVSSQDPTACRTPTTPNGTADHHEPDIMFHPATPTTDDPPEGAPRPAPRHAGPRRAWNRRKGEPDPSRPRKRGPTTTVTTPRTGRQASRPTSPHGETP